jgi:predicted nucleotidyltransferase
MHTLLTHRRDQIAALCRLYGVRRLDVFGRGLRTYFGLKADLEALLARPVDLVELTAMENTRLKRLIERSKVPFYATPA